MQRNFSINVHLVDLAKGHSPKYRFSSVTHRGWRKWRKKLLPAVRSTLGRMPRKVPLNTEILSERQEDGLVKRTVVFDVEEGLSLQAYVFWPADANDRLPGILACHGHGFFGKETVMGNRSASEMQQEIEQYNYDYGLQMAKAGYVVIAIDWRGFGSRSDSDQEYWHRGRDICNMHYIRLTLLGMTNLGLNVHDGMCALDYLCGLDFVAAERIGVMGLSFGGTMATWLTISDERIKAADVICYSDNFAEFAIKRCQFCGSQITPGLYDLCDLPDLHGLIAPRPLLIEIGSSDECFKADSAMKCFREVEKIYTAARVPEKLELDLFDGGHRWNGRKTLRFFEQHLKSR